VSAPGAVWTARFTLLLLVAALWLAAGSRFVAGVWIVAGQSMHPTLRPGEWVVVDRWTLRHRPPRRGELVLLRLPGDPGGPAVKRVSSVAPDGATFEVLGDNPERSRDSREFGAVGREALVGRLVGH
jgi:signal peptidase I